MTDPIQEGQAFVAMLGKGPLPAPSEEPQQVPEPSQEPEAPVEDTLITALRGEGKPWQAELVRLLHPPEKGES